MTAVAEVLKLRTTCGAVGRHVVAIGRAESTNLASDRRITNVPIPRTPFSHVFDSCFHKEQHLPYDADKSSALVSMLLASPLVCTSHLSFPASSYSGSPNQTSRCNQKPYWYFRSLQASASSTSLSRVQTVESKTCTPNLTRQASLPRLFGPQKY
jgi:hypothetical protein